MIIAAQSHDALLGDISRSDQPDAGFRLWWLGQSGFLVQWRGHHLLLDPYLSDSLTAKYAETDKPHVRMTELATRPERLDFIDVVTSSHNHTDHLDAETLIPLMRSNQAMAILTPAANREFAAQRLQTSIDRLESIDAGESITLDAFTFHAVPAAHNKIELDEQGRHRFLGYVVRFGDWTIYHSGDTMRYDGMDEILREWSIDVALLPINGSKPERRVAGNLWGREAAELAHQIGAKLVIPCHFEMFQFNTVTPEEFMQAAERHGQAYRVLRCGERWSSDELPSSASNAG